MVRAHMRPESLLPVPLIAAVLLPVLLLASTARPVEARTPSAVALSGPDSLSMASVMRAEGERLASADSVREAESKLNRALGIERRHAVSLDREVGATLLALGRLARRQSRFPEAADQLREARELFEHALGADSAQTLTATMELGAVLQERGDLVKAKREFERALTSLGRVAPDDVARIAAVQVALGGIARALLDPVGARGFYERALTWLETAGLTADPIYASASHNYASTLRFLGSYDSALVIARRNLAYRERTLGSDDVETATSLALVASLDADLGRFDEAAPLQAEALRISTLRRGRDDPNTLARVINLGNLARARNDHVAAESLYVRLVEGRTRLTGRVNLGVAEAVYNLALTHQVLGRDSLAIAEGLEAAAIRREVWRATIPFLDEDAAMRLTNEWWTGYEIAVDVAGHSRNVDGASVARTWEAVIQMRSLVLDELAARRKDEATDIKPGEGGLWGKWTDARRQLSKAVLSGGKRDSLIGLRDSLEQQLAIGNAALRARRRDRQIGWTDIRRCLPAKSALVGYVRFGRVNQSTALSRWQKDLIFEYSAFLIAPGDSFPRVIRLGGADRIDSLVHKWAEAAQSARGDSASLVRYRRAGEALRRVMWDPIARHLRGATRVFYVPDGALNQVCWEALPTGSTRFLVDEPALLVRLFTERDLAVEPGSSVKRGLLVVGAVDFDSAEFASNEGNARIRGLGPQCHEFESVRFADLPGSRTEAATVQQVWHERVVEPITTLAGRQATASAFAAAAPRCRYLHIATHGFFVPDSCTDASQPQNASMHDPLDRCGLVLAGANARRAGSRATSDGLLTGNDIAGLDLLGVERVVLSACRSGSGDIGRTEGVFGLQRAFRVAGARAIIMSLWPVEDDATSAWMTALYSSALAKGAPAALATREASRTILARLRRADRTPDPRIWGAFIEVGDAR